jgi:hypothetical protein
MPLTYATSQRRQSIPSPLAYGHSSSFLDLPKGLENNDDFGDLFAPTRSNRNSQVMDEGVLAIPLPQALRNVSTQFSGIRRCKADFIGVVQGHVMGV